MIICFYELKDYLYAISTEFEKKYGWTVVSYPLYMHCYDRYSKIDNYVDILSDTFSKEKPHLVLWWFTDVPITVFRRITTENPDTFFIIYNYSDPINMSNMYLERCSMFHYVLTTCYHNQSVYKINPHTKYVDFMPIGFDPTVFRPQSHVCREIDMIDINYRCDISFICDCMYTDQKNQLIERKKLINILINYCEQNNLKLMIYGPEMIKPFIKTGYYKAEPNYIDIPTIAISSKINIITHSDCRKKLGLNSMHLFPIMACGGIVLMDAINGSEMFFNEKCRSVFTFMTADSVVTEIQKILGLYDSTYDVIEQIRQNAINIAKSYSWTEFVDKIYTRYVRDTE